MIIWGGPRAPPSSEAMTFSPPPPEEEKPRVEEESDYGVDTTQATPSWRDEDQWEARPADDDSRWRNSSAPTATDPSKWGSAKTREEAAALQTCQAHLNRALKQERPRTLLGALLGVLLAGTGRTAHRRSRLPLASAHLRAPCLLARQARSTTPAAPRSRAARPTRPSARGAGRARPRACGSTSKVTTTLRRDG